MTRRIVVVGAGPRGISVVERIVARAGRTAPAAEIVLVDPFVGAGGRVWRTDQPAELLMNTMVADNTVFPDRSVRVASPVGTGPSFAEWLADVRSGDHQHGDHQHGDQLRAFAETARARDYAPRAIYGHYLLAALTRVRQAAPPWLHVRTRAEKVREISPLRTGYRVRLAGGELIDAAAVVLATGHLDSAPAPALDGVARIGCGHPTEYPLDTIGAGEEVLVRGAGLNAYDVIARLTTGRGGAFDGAGRYRASGGEPHLWITSRRGVPFHARVDAPGRTAPRVFLGADRVADLLARPVLDFAADVLPLFHADLEIAWYAALPPAAVPETDLAGLLATLRTAEPGSQERGDALAQVPAALRLDLPARVNPLAGRHFADLDGLRAWWRDHLDRDHAAATASVPPPQAALAAAVRQSRPVLRRIITAGTLTSESYRRDVLGNVNGWMNFLSGGPPAPRIRQLRGLLDAGVVDLLGPTAPASPRLGRFTVASAVVAGLTVTPDHVVDAWLPPVDVTTPGPGIIRELLATGLARPHRLRSGRGGWGEPTGALDVDPATGRVRDAQGNVHSGLFAVGVPLEGLRWTTAVGARPGTDAEFFHETDAVAAAVLGEVLGTSATADPHTRQVEEKLG